MRRREVERGRDRKKKKERKMEEERERWRKREKKRRRKEKEESSGSPSILGEDPGAGGVREQSCSASTTSAIRCLCLLASRRSSYAILSSCIMTDTCPL